MFSKIEPPSLDLKNPWSGDLFQREGLAATLCSLLKSTLHSSVIGINAPYGFGKTFFLTRLREQIKNDQGWAIYVNAWEYDYLDNVLFALLDAMKTAAAEFEDKKEISQTIKELSKAAAPAIAKAAGRKLLEKAVGTEGSKELADLVSDVTGRTAEAIVNQYLNEDTTNRTLDVLRAQIQKFVADRIKAESAYKNLIVIVDELDRARPNFAIRFLETIKHIFGLSQVVFVVGCDRSVVASSAQHEYGQRLPVDGYLRRLFDYWIDLPPPNVRDYVFQCADRLNLLKDGILRMNSGQPSDDIDGYAKLLLLGRRPEEVSLRFIEQSVAHAGVVLRLAAVDKQAGLIGWLQNLKQFSPDLHAMYVSNTRVSAIVDSLKSYSPFRSADLSLKAWIVIWAVSNKDKLTTDFLQAMFSGTDPIVGEIDRLLGRAGGIDGRESIAARIDLRMRTVSLHA